MACAHVGQHRRIWSRHEWLQLLFILVEVKHSSRPVRWGINSSVSQVKRGITIDYWMFRDSVFGSWWVSSSPRVKIYARRISNSQYLIDAYWWPQKEIRRFTLLNLEFDSFPTHSLCGTPRETCPTPAASSIGGILPVRELHLSVCLSVCSLLLVHVCHWAETRTSCITLKSCLMCSKKCADLLCFVLWMYGIVFAMYRNVLF